MTSLRDRVDRAAAGVRGAVVILSENPIHDSGGGQRSAQLAAELLERDHEVLFVSRGVVTETMSLGLEYDHPRLLEATLDELVSAEGREALHALLEPHQSTVVAQVGVKAWLPVLEQAREAGAVTVYDCMDPWGSELGGSWYDRRHEKLVARASDLLLASTPALVEHVEALTERETHLVPNAFDARVFRADQTWERPVDLPGGGRIALFVGALWGGWLDWKLVRSVAGACPDIAFVFVGDHRREGAGLPENCSFLGLKRHADLPPYLAHADVAFLPWSVDEMTRAMSPLTVYEHVAMGLPVVAPPIEPLRGMPGVVGAADSREFAEALRSTGRSTVTAEERASMVDFAARNSWVARVDQILALVDGPRRRSSTGTAPAGPPVKTRTMLSVVIPSYNHDRFIGEAVESVRGQSLPAGELLVIDDGSTDASLEVLAEHSFSRMRCLAQPNRGAHHTINRAIALSEGDYIAILNSDDVFEAERLEHAWAVASGSKAALVFGSVRLVDGDGEPLPPDHDTVRWYARARAEARGDPSLASGVRRENVAVTTSNFFIHRELWRRLGGFRDYRYVHDYDFLLRALELCPERVVYAEELCDVRYRVHGDNTIAEDVDRALAERASMLRSLRRPTRRIRSAFALARGSRAVRAAVETAPMLSPVVSAAPAAYPRVRAGIVVRSLHRGGLEEVVALLAQSLPSQGVDTSVLCTHVGGDVADRLRGAGVSVTVGDGQIDYWREWRDETAPHVLSSHFVGAADLEVLGDSGTPVIETVHNTYAWFSADDWSREADKRRLLSATIAVSDTVGRYYDQFCEGDAPAYVVKNAVHPARVARVPRDHARRLLEIPPDDPMFIHVGRITSQKNLSGLLAAFGDLLDSVPHAHLLLVGPPDPSSLPRLKDEHVALFRRGSVRHVPPVRAVGIVLSAADAYVSNSYYEGWSVAASEALWVGLPLVLSETGGAIELVGSEGERGHLVPNPVGDPLAVTPELLIAPPEEPVRVNRAALTEAMHDVVVHRKEWAARAPDARRHARAALAPGQMAAEYARIFREVSGLP